MPKSVLKAKLIPWPGCGENGLDGIKGQERPLERWEHYAGSYSHGGLMRLHQQDPVFTVHAIPQSQHPRQWGAEKDCPGKPDSPRVVHIPAHQVKELLSLLSRWPSSPRPPTKLAGLPV